MLAAPSEVVRYLIEDRVLIGRALGETLGNAAVGFVLGNLAAVALAALALAWPASERVIRGLALLVFCLPLVATGPILRVFFGPGPGPQITLAALAVYYTTLIPLLVGLRAAPDSWVDLVRSYGRGRVGVLIHVRAMAALPYLFAGLQIAAPAAFLGAMVGEFSGAERGLGVLTVRAIRALDVEMTWGVATVATAAAMVPYLAVGLLSRLMTRAAPPVILAAPPTRSGAGGGTMVAWRDVALIVAIMVAGLGRSHPDIRVEPVLRQGAVGCGRGAGAGRRCAGHAGADDRGPGRNRRVSSARLSGRAGGGGGAGRPAGADAGAGRGRAAAGHRPAVGAHRDHGAAGGAVLGRGAVGTVVLVAVMVFFPTFVACLHGLRQAPGQVLDVFDSYAAGPLARLIHVRLPAMLPAFFAAARMAVPASVLAITVVEWLATGAGLGSLMALSASLSDYDMLWSAVVLVSALSALGYGAVSMVERRVLARYAPEQLS